MEIVANIFAGRPNPRLELTDEELNALRVRLEAVRQHPIEPRERREPPVLGYRGFLIFNPDREGGLSFRVEIFGGSIAVSDRPAEAKAGAREGPRLFRDSERIEEWLLDRAAERGYAEAIAAMGGPDRRR